MAHHGQEFRLRLRRAFGRLLRLDQFLVDPLQLLRLLLQQHGLRLVLLRRQEHVHEACNLRFENLRDERLDHIINCSGGVAGE
ncbi:hypothetical protein D3C71_1916930 [compost metagenome]